MDGMPRGQPGKAIDGDAALRLPILLAKGEEMRMLPRPLPRLGILQMADLGEGRVFVDKDALVQVLSFEAFLALQKKHPEVATKLALNIAREQSLNLRRATQEVRMLEES